MATSGNRGGGRRSKGERRFVGSRVPVNKAHDLGLVAKYESLTVSDMISVAIDDLLDRYDLAQLAKELEDEESLHMRQLAS